MEIHHSTIADNYEQGFHKDLRLWLEMRASLNDIKTRQTEGLSESFVSYSKYRNLNYWRDEELLAITKLPAVTWMAELETMTYDEKLRISLEVNHNSFLRALLTSGLDPNYIMNPEYAKSILHMCILRSDYEKTHMLLQAGANPNLKDAKGITPLALALRLPYELFQFQFLDLILQHGADIDARDALGLSPLHIACVRGDVRLVKYLLAAGARMSTLDSQQRFPIDCATKVIFIISNRIS